ncbi:MAG: metallophosphoesterase, partial [Myxococcota bacterium]
MTREELINALTRLSAAEIDMLCELMGANPNLFNRDNVVMKALDLLRWSEARSRREELVRQLNRILSQDNVLSAPEATTNSSVGQPTPSIYPEHDTSPGKLLTILHISDLHIWLRWLDDARIVMNAFLQDVTEYPARNGLNIDLVCFTGDIAQAGTRAEFELARKHLFDPLLSRLGLDREHLFWVPGNHDIDRQ